MKVMIDQPMARKTEEKIEAIREKVFTALKEKGYDVRMPRDSAKKNQEAVFEIYGRRIISYGGIMYEECVNDRYCCTCGYAKASWRPII